MPLTVEQKFEAFDAANPKVYALFKRFAYELITAGVPRLSSKAIVERIRWETTISTTGSGWHAARGKPFLIDNRFTPWLSRRFIAEYPRLGAKFETREIRTP